MTKAELLKKLKAMLYRGYGRRCRQFNISCAICSVWMAYDILEDHLLFDIDAWLKPKKWFQFWK